MSNHIYPSTMTRLAARQQRLIENMANNRAEAEQLKRIYDQIAAGGNWQALAAEIGYDLPADAETAYNLIGSCLVDDLQGAFYSQVISRMG
jgi:hypothetical protein